MQGYSKDSKGPSITVQLCKRKHYYGYGNAVYKEVDFEGERQFSAKSRRDFTHSSYL
jgi:hypothetical protein